MEGMRTMQHERLTIQEAAHRLGVSESAVRKRIKRGTLQREKTEDGRALVYMEPSVPGVEEVRTPEREALISEMQQRLALLERELHVRTEENYPNRSASASPFNHRVCGFDGHSSFQGSTHG